MSANPLVSVIILNWNRPDDTMAVLSDLKNQTYDNCEIILVDNASSDDSADVIEAKFEDVKVVRAPTNLGVPGGRNLGVEHAAGEIMFFLDNDALLEREGLRKIVDVFRQNADVSIISCHIENHKTGELDYDSWVYPKAQLGQASERFNTYSFCGCGYAVRRSLFDEIGLLNGCFFFCREEDEFSIRALARGRDIMYCGDIIVRHKTAPEGRYAGPNRLTYCLRNLLLTIWTYFPAWQAIKMTLFRLVVYAEKGRRAGSWSVAPKGLMGAWKLKKDFEIERTPMDKQTWNQYCDLNMNLNIHIWELHRIREEFGGSMGLSTKQEERP